MTIRQLFWAVEGHREDLWAHTSNVMALLFNCHRDPNKGKPASADDFNPYAKRKPKPKATGITIGMMYPAFAEMWKLGQNSARPGGTLAGGGTTPVSLSAMSK